MVVSYGSSPSSNPDCGSWTKQAKTSSDPAIAVPIGKFEVRVRSHLSMCETVFEGVESVPIMASTSIISCGARGGAESGIVSICEPDGVRSKGALLKKLVMSCVRSFLTVEPDA